MSSAVQLVKPPRLQRGDIIAVGAYSSVLSLVYPKRIDRGVQALRDMGFDVMALPSLGWSIDGICAGSAVARVSELHDMFLNPSVKMVISAIGGHSSLDLLAQLDYELIRNNPTGFCGYSDNTLLLNAMLKYSGLVGFYGPCVMTQFAEWPMPLNFTADNFVRAVMSNRSLGVLPRSVNWTEEFIDWGSKDGGRRRRVLKQGRWEWLSFGKAVRKPLLGGCLASILQLKGTSFEPNYEDSVLLLETGPGEQPSTSSPIEAIWAQFLELDLTGIFDVIAGAIVGRPFGLKQEDQPRFRQIVRTIVARTGRPVLYGVDVGHTDPMLTLPLGVRYTLDSRKDFFSCDEVAVKG